MDMSSADRKSQKGPVRGCLHAAHLRGHVGKVEQRSKAEGYLQQHRGTLQQEMSHRVQLKYSPLVRFTFDDSIAMGNNVLDIIEEIEQSGDLET